MAKTVTLIKENPKKKRNPSKRKANPVVAVPVAGNLNFPGVQETVGLVAGGSAAVMIPSLLQRFIGGFTASLGPSVGNIVNIVTAWGTNLWIAKQLSGSGVDMINARSFRDGANTVHALQLISTLIPGQNVLGVRIPSVSGPKAQTAIPAATVTSAPAPVPMARMGSTQIGTAQSQTDPVTGDEAFISVT